ncbi:oxygen tolerance domain protein [Pantoea sp. FN060301]|uniref:oxygen tolerance domain protein n=1 Tax=Pantoea sp. FN060301 TaxID=3420380 RepID=UPI003D165957
MRRFALLLLMLCLPARADMTMTRELNAPNQLVPGQPVTLAVTFWTDSWFTPPPQWPEMVIENGSLLTTPLPNQLVTRKSQGISWSGIRMERKVMAWDRGQLRLPAIDIVMRSAGQPPKTLQLPALKKNVVWPGGVLQPDRFLPASSLQLMQKWRLYRAAEDQELHVGDVIERVVTLRASDVTAAQIPQLLYAIPGSGTQRLPPVNTPLTHGRGEITGAQREERLRYLPSAAGDLTLPPVRLRWWDTRQQIWQQAELPGARYEIGAPRTAGGEQALQAKAPVAWRALLVSGAIVAALLAMLIVFRRAFCHAIRFILQRIRTFWRPVPLPELTPVKRNKR